MALLARLGALTRLSREAYRNAYFDGMQTLQLAQLRRSPQGLTPRARAARMAANGFDASATILSVRPTGQRIAGEHVVELDVTVAVDRLAPYPLTIRRVVPAASRVTPGDVLAAKVDRNDQTVVWIDFERSG